jgi:hypothetical protein
MSEPPDYYEAAQLLSESSVLPSPFCFLHPPHTTVSSPRVIFVSSAPPKEEGSASEERSSDSNQTPWWKKIHWKAGNKSQIPLGEVPNVTQSLLAIVKLSCGHLPSVALRFFFDSHWSDLVSNVLLIFVPLSVSVSYDGLARVESHT